MNCKTARQWIEVCRPGSEDLRDPELAGLAEHLMSCPACLEVFHRCQAWDATLGQQMRNVNIPAGLKERLLAQSAQTAPDPEIRIAPLSSDGPKVASIDAPATDRVRSRVVRRLPWGFRPRHHRRWVLGAGAAAFATLAAAVLLWVFGLATTRGTDLDALIREVLRLERAQLEPQFQPADLEQRLLTARIANDLGLRAIPSQHLRLEAMYGYRKVRLRQGEVAVFFYAPLRNWRQSRARVYAIPSGWLRQPAGPFPPTFRSSTGGITVAAWRERAFVYLFVAPGESGAELLQLLEKPTGPLT